jgi:hypothetical protein
MASIGGLDLPYGSQTQIVRTNVLCVAIADTGLANATTVPKFVLNTYKEALKGSVIEPDFLYFYEIGDTDGSGFTTAAVANGLFNQDTDGDGTADNTALHANGVLRDIRQVPLTVTSAHADTTAAHAAEGATHTLHDDGNISGNLQLMSVLSASAFALDDGSGDAANVDVFTDDAPSPAATVSEGMFGQYVEAVAFAGQYTKMHTAASTGLNYGNLDAGGISTGARKGPFTLNLQSLLEHLDGTGIATGAAAATVDAYTSATTFATMTSDLNGDAGIISITSLAKVV